MDRIILQGLKFYGHHGVLPEERRVGQFFLVDLELELDLRPAGISDDLAATVDYGQVYHLVRGIVAGERYHLLEALAERLAASLLELPGLTGVRIRVAKPRPPLAGPLDQAAVAIYRQRR